MDTQDYLRIQNLINNQQKRLTKIVNVIDHMEELLEQERKELDALYYLNNRETQ